MIVVASEDDNPGRQSSRISESNLFNPIHCGSLPTANQDQESRRSSPLEIGSNDNVHQHLFDQGHPLQPRLSPPTAASFLTDNRTDPADILLVAGFDALGNTLEEVGQCITELEPPGHCGYCLECQCPRSDPQCPNLRSGTF